MSWATHLIEKLRRGETVSVIAPGNSMSPRIRKGEKFLIRPVQDRADLAVEDIVLVHVAGRDFCHKIKSIDSHGRYQISNQKGFVNGKADFDSIFGKVVS